MLNILPKLRSTQTLLTTVFLALASLQPVQAQLNLTNYFAIEAEDYNFDRGQTLAVASQMPYLGGAYVGKNGSVISVDYNRSADPSSPLYRNDVRIPMLPSTDLGRQAWSVTQNFRLSAIKGSEWFNYTRDFPPGKYKIYAALSHADVGDGLCQGSFSLINSGATNTSQTVVKKGTFNGAGTGSWDQNRVLPLLDTAGRLVLVDLRTNQTVRYTATSGYVDYLLCVRAQPPVIANQFVDVTVIENRPATFSVTLATDDPAAFQWQTNQVNYPKATNSVFAIVPSLTADGTLVRCVLTNVIGTNITAEVTLHVIPDTAKPVAVRAMNVGPDRVRVFFDEPVVPPGGDADANFSISGGIAVTSAVAGADPSSLDLSLASPLTYDQTYTVTLSGVLDLATTPNTILPGSKIDFWALQFVPTDIGKPGAAGSSVRVPGGFNVTGAGSDIGGTSDQFQFSWEPRTGDFDVQGRVAKATITDSFLHAGLMARETLAASAPFAAAFASSAQLGCFFEVRKTAGAAATSSSSPSGVPVNYPDTWLRLRRAGNVFSGYASLNGRTWVLLGNNTFSSISNTVLVGLAVASESSTVASQVEFRDFGPTLHDSTVSNLPDHEMLGPSSRRTGLVFSEIMYHPRPVPGAIANLEFIEIYNAGAIFEELKGYEITGGVHYSFPDDRQIQAGQFLVVAADPAAVEAAYGITGVLGPWTGSLKNKGDTIQLKDGRGALKLEVTYSADPPWPVAADGAGPSLVLARPSYGENEAKAWSASARIGGSPGEVDPYPSSPQQSVVINEFLAHTTAPQLDFIELYNHSNGDVPLDGCYLTDDPATNKFKIPPGTTIAARGFVSFDENQLGFNLSARGATIYFLDPSATRILDAIRFEAQDNGVSSGRFPDGSANIRPLAMPTPATMNAMWKQESIVINEIMYSPISQDSDDEYVELYNRSAAAVDLSGWSFTAGINFTIPAGTVLAPDGYLVIAHNTARLLANYPQLNAANTVGNYSGTLSDGGERLALARPITIVGNTVPLVVSEVTYGTAGRWGKWSNGGGSSLELIDPHADLQQAADWADSDESAKGQWTDLTVTSILDNGNGSYPPNKLQILQQGAGECLVDEVRVFKVGSTNLLLNGDFESTNSVQKWEIRGTHSLSTVDTNGGFNDSRCLHIRAQGHGDTGVNSVRHALQAGLASGNTATMQAKVRWLAGWPEILFRLQGNWMELPGQMPVPKNLGTPGLVNSRRISNAGPAVYAVSHSPALPRANQPVVVTCRVSDPDGLGALTLRYRFDPITTLTNVVMKDDGTGGDEIAGDGIYSGSIPGRATGLAAFRIEASDAAGMPASTVFPAGAPAQECLIRWNESIPLGTFGHYHLWSTTATESARGASTALNNFYRDATLVYGNGRILYNVGFRDKGSPYHGGAGDFAVTVPTDDLLLGTSDRIFGATGNGGPEDTGLRGRVANWFAREMGLPYLHAHYILLYRNGSLHQTIDEDNEQPSNNYAASWFPSTATGELFKIAVWFEDDSTSGATSATMEQFRTTGGVYDLARYRWNWQLRANDSANNFTNLFKLVDAVNTGSAVTGGGEHVPGLLNISDMEEWMRVFAYHRVVGNWDSWTYSVGQNMFLYRQPGTKWVLFPWDIDFVLGLGGAATDPLGGGGQDPVANARFWDNPTFRRMMYRAFLDAIAGPMQPARYGAQVEARRSILAKNKITGLTPPSAIAPYVDQRREYLRSQLAASDASSFAITNNNGNNFTSASAVTTLSGTAPFAVATIEVNSIPYPVKWTSFTTFAITVPLANGTNILTLVGRDLRGNPVRDASDSITIQFKGVPQLPSDFVVIHEIQYHPAQPKASFLELFNRSTTTPFDLSNYRIDGLKYVFPEGSIMAPNSYLLLVQDRASFALAYGSSIPIFDQFSGSLNSGGEHLRLVKPGLTPEADLVINDVRYENHLPWPVQADGFGPSLQLIDATRDTYRVGNWAVTDTNDLNLVTPGRTNAARQSLPAFPLVWLNEVLPKNGTGPVDNAGDHDPFIELYNSGASAVDLSAYYLTGNYTNLTQWQFPAGTILPGKSFLTLWADGDPGQTIPGALHTGFRIKASGGSLALVRMQGVPSGPAVMDYLDYGNLPVDQSFGSYPDGEPRHRRSFFYPTLGTTNNPFYPDLKVTINEVMASNLHTLEDSANGLFSDWFELYNAGDLPVDLTSYRLTDNLTNTTQFVIPSGYVIPAGGFLLVWADGDPSLNRPSRPDLHVNFKISQSGEELGLFAPDDRMVDGLSFPAQLTDVSLGHFPNGAAGPLVYMPVPTPRGSNDITHANFPPSVTAVANQTLPELSTLTVDIHATDPNPGQTLVYSLVNGPPLGAAINASTGRLTWTPDETQGPENYRLTVLVTDNGVPPLSNRVDILVQVTEVNSVAELLPIPNQIAIVNLPLRFQAQAVDADFPAQRITFSLAGGSPLGAGINPDTGDFFWSPSSEQLGVFEITVQATDDGVPPLMTSRDVMVTVKEPDPVPPPVVAALWAPDGSLTISWAALDGVTYQVQSKSSLNDVEWVRVAEAVGANGMASLSGINPREQRERYFRVVVLP